MTVLRLNLNTYDKEILSFFEKPKKNKIFIKTSISNFYQKIHPDYFVFKYKTKYKILKEDQRIILINKAFNYMRFFSLVRKVLKFHDDKNNNITCFI